ncbi:hypothetical protein BKA93DRAFT_824484 [Sparassis latifolia]
MSVILGRAVKTEYLAIGTILGAVGLGMLSAGGKKETAAPAKTIEQVKETVKFTAGSSEEEEFIKKFVADAEKEEAKH